jgi:hypothetical protein
MADERGINESDDQREYSDEGFILIARLRVIDNEKQGV